MIDRRGSRRTAWLLAAIVLCAPACAAGGGNLQVTYLGNEGFLLRAGEESVLIDAIHGDGLRGYVALPPEPRTKLEAAAPPFGEVDLVLATHAHGDHLDARATARYLKAAKQARFVSTERAVDLVRKLIGDDAGIENRIRGHYPKPAERVELKPRGIALQLFRLPHGTTQSLGFVVEVGGKKVLHIGDTEADASYFAQYELSAQKIDVALIPFWLFLSSSGRAAVHEIGATQVVAMHVPDVKAPAQYFGDSANLEQLYRDLQEAWPGIVLMKEPLETRRFE